VAQCRHLRAARQESSEPHREHDLSGSSGRRHELFVAELDAINGTPVLDLKPVMAEFLPRQGVRQPSWSHELMREYWLHKG